MFPIRRPDQFPWVIGHRGARAYAPENTLTSFRKAAELGADLIECDVHFSRDRRLVVIHDESVDRTTNGSGLVRDLDLTELKRLDAGGGERILTLEELLSWVRTMEGLGIMIEIKMDLSTYPKISESVVDAVLRNGMNERSVVVSFDYAVVHEVKNLDRGLATGVLLSHKVADPIAVARETHADSLGPSLNILTPTLVRTARAHRLGIFTWTVNEPKQIELALNAGVDAVGTDVPDVLRAYEKMKAPRSQAM